MKMMNGMEKREVFVSQQLQKAAENLQEAIVNARKYRKGSSRRFSEPEVTCIKEDQENNNFAEANDNNNNEKNSTKSNVNMDIKELSTSSNKKTSHLEILELDNQEIDDQTPQENSPPKWSQGSFASSSSSSSLASIFDGTNSNQKEEQEQNFKQQEVDSRFSIEKPSKKPTRSFGPSRSMSLSTRPTSAASYSSDVETRRALSFMLAEVETKAKQNKECMGILTQSVESISTFINKELGCASKNFAMEENTPVITAESLQAKQEQWLYSLQAWKQSHEEKMKRLQEEHLQTIERLEAKTVALTQQLQEKEEYLDHIVNKYTTELDTLQDQADSLRVVSTATTTDSCTQTTTCKSTRDMAINTQEEMVMNSSTTSTTQTCDVDTVDLGCDPFIVGTRDWGVNTVQEEEKVKEQMLSERLTLLQDRLVEAKEQIDTNHQVFQYEQMKFDKYKQNLTSELTEMQHVLTKCLKVVLQREKQVKQEEQTVKNYHTLLLTQEEELNQEQLFFEKKKRQILQELMEHSAMLLLSTKQQEQSCTNSSNKEMMSASKPMTISQLTTQQPNVQKKKKSMILQVKPSRLVKLLRRLKEMDKISTSTFRKTRQIVDEQQQQQQDGQDEQQYKEEDNKKSSKEEEVNTCDFKSKQKEIAL